jgi:hypothetical protein
MHLCLFLLAFRHYVSILFSAALDAADRQDFPLLDNSVHLAFEGKNNKKLCIMFGWMVFSIFLLFYSKMIRVTPNMLILSLSSVCKIHSNID